MLRSPIINFRCGTKPALEPRSFYSHQSSAQAYEANKQANQEQGTNQIKALKERAKG
jgi:hypothetical protein